MALKKLPAGAWLLGIPGLACLVAGLLLLAGFGTDLHPLLQESGAGLVLLVSGVALVGSAAFPLVLAELAAKDGDPPASQ
ncbi:MAG: hypothetical protein KAX47_02185 [Zoogloea sp.]|uniref:hypothetical protein n=1 Tax=Zoogloea sp. TaxID=49181 RepID=UPI001B58DFF4|nr:hypothetical protein [Zoogloea sp.]MBP8265333.1 hypothetical protein [Zoogloea sp.]HQA11917.1 hypothetical protein [Zoogloea sp.]HQE41195.1 hypothetical protein [Zoogloea sp.]